MSPWSIIRTYGKHTEIKDHYLPIIEASAFGDQTRALAKTQSPSYPAYIRVGKTPPIGTEALRFRSATPAMAPFFPSIFISLFFNFNCPIKMVSHKNVTRLRPQRAQWFDRMERFLCGQTILTRVRRWLEDECLPAPCCRAAT